MNNRRRNWPELLPYVSMTRETALRLAAEERLEKFRQQTEQRRRNQERWNLK